MRRSHRRPCRSKSWSARGARWFGTAAAVILIVGLVGRGHLFQALGFAVACADGGAAHVDTPEHADGDGHREGGPSTEERHCPPSCPECPCGQPRLVLPVYIPLVEAWLLPIELTMPEPRVEVGQVVPHRLDRPPRSASA